MPYRTYRSCTVALPDSQVFIFVTMYQEVKEYEMQRNMIFSLCLLNRRT